MKKVIIFIGENDQYYFRIVGKNNKTIAQSEGYKLLASAVKTAKLFGVEIKLPK
jgi:uncharacterized protein YegP (UPF0339 family)